MRRGGLVLLAFALIAVGLAGVAQGDVVDACQAGPAAVAVPGTTITCTVGPVACNNDCSYVARVVVNGIGIVGARVTTTEEFDSKILKPRVLTGRCGPALNTCEAVAGWNLVPPDPGDPVPILLANRISAQCTWTGTLALNASIACDLVVAERAFAGGNNN